MTKIRSDDDQPNASPGDASRVTELYIDDSGTPGVTTTTPTFHSKRKSWAGVLISPSVAEPLSRGLASVLTHVETEYGAGELHFTDIYSGNAYFKGVPFEERLGVFRVVANLLLMFDVPIFVQTLSPENFAEISRKVSRFGSLGGLNYRNYKDVALSFLASQVSKFVEDDGNQYVPPVKAWCDAGRMKTGNQVIIGSQEMFVDGALTFIDSHASPFLQLADFAAFAIGKVQWLATKPAPKDWELKFVEMISELNMPNILKVRVPKQSVGPDTYETMLEFDRMMKGLGPMPREER